MTMTAHHAFSLARIVKNACLRVLFYQTVMLFIRLILVLLLHCRSLIVALTHSKQPNVRTIYPHTQKIPF